MEGVLAGKGPAGKGLSTSPSPGKVIQLFVVFHLSRSLGTQKSPLDTADDYRGVRQFRPCSL